MYCIYCGLYSDVLNFNTRLPSTNGFNPIRHSTTPLNEHNKHVWYVKLSDRGDNSLACGRSQAAADGQDRCLKSELRGSCRANGRSLMNDSYSPPSWNITWALPPTQHSTSTSTISHCVFWYSRDWWGEMEITCTVTLRAEIVHWQQKSYLTWHSTL